MNGAIIGQPVATRVLNRLLQLLSRSLPRYVEHAVPCSACEQREVRGALGRLVTDQQMFAGRVARAILDRGSQPEPGPFPLEFAALNYVCFRFLMKKIVAGLRSDLETMGRCVADLVGDPDAQALAEEVLGNAQGHLDILQDIEAQMTRDAPH